ncbi:MAG: VapC toxin family PIN domain ribonuclease [Caldithrix sp.]|nr:MAG: VapC toxin family PIN domain ribonuclease [Caldithrix sp.]
MRLVVDSVIIAVITNERHKQALVELTKGAELVAPHALHWEIGNAFSALFKRKRVDLQQAIDAVQYYKTIPIRFCDVQLDFALEIANELNIYAYDAYFIGCASKYSGTLASLDHKLIDAAESFGIKILEVSK